MGKKKTMCNATPSESNIENLLGAKVSFEHCHPLKTELLMSADVFVHCDEMKLPSAHFSLGVAYLL